MHNLESEEEEKYQEKQKRFSLFCSELEKLSKQYGVLLDITGGVTIVEKNSIGNIKSVEYTDDSSSGDINSNVVWCCKQS